MSSNFPRAALLLRLVLFPSECTNEEHFLRGEGGNIAQWLSCLCLDPAAWGSNPSVSQKICREKIINVIEANQWRCLEESEQWLETHLVPAKWEVII